jgi:hypothetical protein
MVTVRDEAVHEIAKYETHQQNVTKVCSKMADNAHLQVRKYETHLEEEESVDTYMDDANNTHQQDVPKAYETADDAQHLLMHEQSIPRAFFINKALPEVCTIQRKDATSLSDPTSTNIEMKAKEETKRGLQFLHISDYVSRQSGTITDTRRPPMPEAAPKKEHNVQVIPCQEEMRVGACVHIIDMPETHRDNTYKEETIYDKELATNDKEIVAAALAIYDGKYAILASHDREFAAAVFITTYDEEPTAATLASYDEEVAAAATLATCREDTADVEGEPWGHN